MRMPAAPYSKRLTALVMGLLSIAVAADPKSLLSISKTPFESFNCSIDFSSVAGADGISLQAVVATNLQTGASTGAAIIAASPAPSVVGDVVVFRVQGGSNGQTHVIGVRVTDSITGEMFEGQITLVIDSATGR